MRLTSLFFVTTLLAGSALADGQIINAQTRCYLKDGSFFDLAGLTPCGDRDGCCTRNKMFHWGVVDCKTQGGVHPGLLQDAVIFNETYDFTNCK